MMAEERRWRDDGNVVGGLRVALWWMFLVRSLAQPMGEGGQAPPGPPAAQPVVDQDVVEYFSQTFKRGVVPQCESKVRGSSACIHVNEAGEIIHSRDLAKDAGSSKQMLMDMFLRGVIEDLKESGRWPGKWMSFMMVYTASGPHHREAFPVLGFGKREPRWQPGLLVPNPFFATPRWWDELQAEQTASGDLVPWETRRRAALFRGACGPGALPRLELLRLPDEDGQLDVGFTKVDGYKTMEECVETLAKKGKDVSDDDVRFVLQQRILPHVPQSNFSQFKYLVHMPGSATGSYSRNLQYLWTHGSVILIWQQDAIEHYYQYMVAGEHYLSVNQTTIHHTLASLERDPALQQKLRDGSRRFAHDYLSGKSLVNRWHAIFDTLARRQAAIATMPDRRPPSDAACTCEPALLASNQFTACAKCVITQLKGSKFRKFLGVQPKT